MDNFNDLFAGMDGEEEEEGVGGAYLGRGLGLDFSEDVGDGVGGDDRGGVGKSHSSDSNERGGVDSDSDILVDTDSDSDVVETGPGTPSRTKLTKNSVTPSKININAKVEVEDEDSRQIGWTADVSVVLVCFV